jgi:hypothetical protein
MCWWALFSLASLYVRVAGPRRCERDVLVDPTMDVGGLYPPRGREETAEGSQFRSGPDSHRRVSRRGAVCDRRDSGVRAKNRPKSAESCIQGGSTFGARLIVTHDSGVHSIEQPRLVVENS